MFFLQQSTAREATASRHHGGPPQTTQTQRHYGIEGIKGAIQLAPLYAWRRASQSANEQNLYQESRMKSSPVP